MKSEPVLACCGNTKLFDGGHQLHMDKEAQTLTKSRKYWTSLHFILNLCKLVTLYNSYIWVAANYKIEIVNCFQFGNNKFVYI